jgi:hypothetical protein
MIKYIVKMLVQSVYISMVLVVVYILIILVFGF